MQRAVERYERVREREIEEKTMEESEASRTTEREVSWPSRDVTARRRKEREEMDSRTIL